MMNGKKKLIPVILIALAAALLVFLLLARACAEPESRSAEPAAAAEQSEAVSEAADTPEPAEEDNTAEIAGQYEITAMITDGKETPAEDLELMKGKGLTCTLTLDPDGTGVLDLFGEESDLTWDGETISTDETEMSYTWENGRLTVVDGDSSLTFLRAEQP